ncbi:ATP-binding protein [Candidatus Palauibacter sp.]|uniref:ATP-binding protein n=1 Tax=Candidatus Palauibacter sp. TaxID=3101350 RepID=UPI003AF285E5
MRDFNTAGPVRADKHYCIPPLERLNLAEVLALVRRERYFVLHAPRQTGKTSALLALRDLLNGGAEGDYRCAYVNVEPAQTAREDVGRAIGAILDGIAMEARYTLGDAATADAASSLDATARPDSALGDFLARWCTADPRPLVLLLDEIDALVGDSLVSVLRQLRAGYVRRPDHFPGSVVLCGIRDVRDYRIHASSEREVIAGGSAFNIKAESLRLGDFTETEIRDLLGQHTAETGQEFAPEALDVLWEQTRGQPWLVNALAREMCFEHQALRLRDRPLSEADVFEAREALILRRDTHIDQLADKLREPRVRRVIEPLLSGGDATYSDHDREYVRDLGLVAPDAPLRIANPIYAEVVPRELTWVLQDAMPRQTPSYVDADGGLDLDKLLAAFQEFFRENSEHWIKRAQYTEAGPQLVLQAFLHRIVNAAGRIEREYALGSRRVDLLVVWPRETGRADRFAVECKLLRGGRERTIERGLAQTAAYMDISAADAGHLVIFDMRETRSWDERIFREPRTAPDGKRITVWGM